MTTTTQTWMAWPLHDGQVSRAHLFEEGSPTTVCGLRPAREATEAHVEVETDDDVCEVCLPFETGELRTESCPACGDLIDQCRGHGEMGDPLGFEVLAAHDEGIHEFCHPSGCAEATATG